MSSSPNRDRARSGRRPGESGTREAILAAARRQFADRGYAASSMRGIAAEAGVDQKLIAHFFGSKQGLFLTAIGLPVNPVEILPGVLRGGDPGQVTERLTDVLTAILEQPQLIQRIAAVIRGAATEEDVAHLLREFFPARPLEAVRGLLGPGDPELRLNLFGSQIVGLVMVREVLAIEPLASMPPRAIAVSVAPTLARYLIGPLDDDQG